MARDNFTEATKKLLAEKVGYICLNPFCITDSKRVGNSSGRSIRFYWSRGYGDII